MIRAATIASDRLEATNGYMIGGFHLAIVIIGTKLQIRVYLAGLQKLLLVIVYAMPYHATAVVIFCHMTAVVMWFANRVDIGL